MEAVNCFFFFNKELKILLLQFFKHLTGKTISVGAIKDVLNPGDELNTTSYLVSSGGNFTLGFFTNADFGYLGIWHTKAGHGKKVWVANRDTPIHDSLGVALIIDDLGNLGVEGNGFFNIFYNQDGSGNTTNKRAVLEDSGNFILYDTTKNQTLWQSFDNPTDTLVPGMKLGYNLTTKKNWTLTSSANDDDPASGAFTMRLEQYQNSPQLLIYRRGKLYWASGPWNKTIGTFQLMIGSHSHFPYDLISDPSGMYLIVKTIGSVSSTMQLSPNGQFFDSSSMFLSSPDFCYGYQSDDGCVISTWPKCRDQIGNYQWESGSWIVNSSNYDDNSSISLGDCMERCWNDCNCAGCMTNTNGTGCITWTEDNIFGLDDSGSTGQKYVLVTLKSPSKKRIWRWILVSIAIFLTSALTTYLSCVKIRICLLKAKEKRRRDDYLHQLTGSDSFNYGDELEKGVKDAPYVKIFSLKAILTATDNFSNENKLGQGGYGPVYKGKLFDGREIAVKRLSKTSGQGMQEFKSELILISKLQHTNLVRLYGCCIHREEKMLIYEFMPNKSLDFFIFAKGKDKKIDWQMRFNIIEGVAQGLLYLHKYSRMRVIHRDLKVSNVLLDENMNPKIADFGLARIFKQDVTKAFTNRVVGTRGYMAPEYAMEGTFSIKSDVFSFGVLILEIVSGKKNSSFYNLDRPLNLVGYAWELWKGQAALELKDERLGEFCDVKQLLRAVNVGLLCVQENANDRPTMSKVISMLNNDIIDLPSPKKPAFFTGRQVVEVRSSETSSTENGSVSKNGLTVTTMEAR